MKIEKIRDNKKVILPIIVGLLLILTVTLLVSRAKYRITSSIPIAEGKITNNPYDFKIEEMYIKDSSGEITAKDGRKYRKIENERMPGSEYTINEKNSYCILNGMEDPNVRIYTNGSGEHVITNINKRSNCYIYFDGESNGRAKEYILTNKEILERKSENKDFNVPFGEDTTGKIYEAQDDDGATYYYAGNPSDNWVKFGGYYWRIIRINGDGTIRMIYQGTEPNATGEGTQIGTSKFNELSNNNAYVGYFYTVGQVRGLGTPSTAYTTLNNWFASSNIKQGSQYYQYIDENAGFCGDRQPSTSKTEINNQGGTGTTTTYYGAYVRLFPGGLTPSSNSLAVNPSYNCADNTDLYTYTGANQGNKKLGNPVGMITADEVSYAGIVHENKSLDNYLKTGSHYWTMTPFWYNNGTAVMFYVNSYGYFNWMGNDGVNWSAAGIRPVINLKADIGLTGKGTTTFPYEVLPDLIKDKEILERKSENKDFNVPFGEDTTGKIYKANDDDGATYYYAGNPSDNWVKFGGYYWRIIRINGDGTIRMIYQGTEPNVTGIGTQINGDTYAFNSSYDNSAYVGYWYQTGVLRGLQSPSNAYTELNNWFANSNIKQGSSYFDLIDSNAGFCGDRTSSTSQTEINNQGGTGTTTTYYGAYVRLRPGGSAPTSSSTAVNPTFNCAHNNDLYTYSGANQGNNKLGNPVGLITADEASYAGLAYGSSNITDTNYLTTGQHYWTMSPSRCPNANVFVVGSSGCFVNPSVNDMRGIRPVINLKSSVTFTGKGTSDNPYVLS